MENIEAQIVDIKNFFIDKYFNLKFTQNLEKIMEIEITFFKWFAVFGTKRYERRLTDIVIFDKDDKTIEHDTISKMGQVTLSCFVKAPKV